MATFPSDSVRTKTWGSEVLTSSDLHAQLDLLHNYIQAALDASTGHAHDGTSNQGPVLSPANLAIASQAAADVLVASSASAWKRLAKGTGLQVLRMNSGATDVEWGSAISAASQAEQETGTEAAKYVAPATQQFHPSAAKGWIKFDGTSGSIGTGDASYNVTSVTDNGTGDYTVNWATDFSSANYAIAGFAFKSGSFAIVTGNDTAGLGAGTSRVSVLSNALSAIDPTVMCVIAFGDQA